MAMNQVATLVLAILYITSYCLSFQTQRQVCPSVRDYQSQRRCKGVPDKCSSDTECTGLSQRCCQTENKCYLSCQDTVIQAKDSCPISIDLALLLDSSGSVGRRNFHRLQRFAKRMVDKFDISENGSHIGVITYSTHPVIEIKFDKYSGPKLNSISIKRDIDGFRLQRGLTFIDKALDVANTTLFTKEAGMRKDTRKVCLVVTDGIQETKRGPYKPLISASQPLKDRGIYVYALGIGSNINATELQAMASKQEYVFIDSTFKNLASLIPGIVNAICGGITRIV